MNRTFSSIDSHQSNQYLHLGLMSTEPPAGTRRYPRVSLPKGMPVSWYGGDLQLFSRVKTLGMGGLFISAPNPPPVGTKLRLAFEVPGGSVWAEAVVRDIIPGEGLGVEFTRMDLGDKLLLQKLLNRLLQ
jgi:PilZ domain